MIKFISTILSVCFLFSCTTHKTVGTADDVGTISGQLFTETGTSVDYPVTVTLYRNTAAESDIPLSENNSYTVVEQQETSNGEYMFDSLPASYYRIEVTEDEIIVASGKTISLFDDSPVENSITVEEVITIPFTVNNPEVFSVMESFISNSKVISTDSGYNVKTVKSNMHSLKIVVSQSSTTDTVSVQATFTADETVRFDIVSGPEELRITPPDTDTTTIEPVTTAFPGMKLIQAGTFIMGPSISFPWRADTIKVFRNTTLTHDFWMDSTEVTQKQFTELMTKWYPSYQILNWDSLQSLRASGWKAGDNYPAYSISWIDAILYCNAKTRESGSTDTIYSYAEGIEFTDKTAMSEQIITSLVTDLSAGGFHLPTEAQWEYACRAGTTTDYYFDVEKIDEYAWVESSDDSAIQPVALLLPNAYGLYDMCGNVFEWCNDNERLEWDYDTTETVDPVGPEEALLPLYNKMLRGGSADRTSYLNRSFDRIGLPYDNHNPPNGFRTCKTVENGL